MGQHFEKIKAALVFLPGARNEKRQKTAKKRAWKTCFS